MIIKYSDFNVIHFNNVLKDRKKSEIFSYFIQFVYNNFRPYPSELFTVGVESHDEADRENEVKEKTNYIIALTPDGYKLILNGYVMVETNYEKSVYYNHPSMKWDGFLTEERIANDSQVQGSEAQPSS